jgi:HKD family nuclease
MSVSTQFISNESAFNHIEVIIENMISADEIWMSTAFLKSSGLNLLIPSIKKHVKAQKPLTIIAGQHFGLTDPEALLTLFELFKPYPKANIYLDKAVRGTEVFHPKLFLFKKGNTGVIISGSANITAGGLIGNTEVSLKVETSTNSTEWKEAQNFLINRCSEEHADLLSLMILNRYKSYQAEEKNKRKRQKAAPEKNSNDFSFNYVNLKKHLDAFRKQYGNDEFEERVETYEIAKAVLDEIIDSPRLTQKRFEELLDSLVVGERLWHSGSLYRHRKEVYKHRNEFRELLRFIRDNQDAPVARVFEGAKERVKEIKGAAVNYITEMMMTYQPDKFANLNKNPITVLKEEAGVYFKSHSSSFNGQDYSDYCLLLKEMAEELGLSNMLEVDSFFNDIYWKIK